MSSQWGRNIKLSVFGESHGPAIGAVIDGLPAGMRPDFSLAELHMARRGAAGKPWATARAEQDRVEVLSGIKDGRLTGSPLCISIANADTHSASYGETMTLPRPGHADYPAHVRFQGYEDHRGGGHFSGRLTAPIVFAGALAMQLLALKGVAIGSHLSRIGDVADKRFISAAITASQLQNLIRSQFPTLMEAAASLMLQEIMAAKANGDSVGGEIETAAIGLPAGIGSPLFDGLESAIAALLFAIPAVKAVEFGEGSGFAKMHGSLANDPYVMKDGSVITASNHNGGILGGISSGMPLILRVAVKPTPSISLEQQTVNLETMEQQSIQIRGRHDPCIAPRALPVVEAALALALLDAWYDIEPRWRQP